MSDDLYTALAELQANPPTIRRKAEGQVGTSRKFKYADLDTIWQATADWRNRHGITWICRPNIISPLHEATTIRALSYELHHSGSGQSIVGDYPLPATGDGQALGAAITYARRYAFCAVTGLIAEDDTDGQPPRERTRAKIPGPDHERLRDAAPPDPERVTRAKAGDGDPWQDQPPGPPVNITRSEARGTIDGRQDRAIMGRLGRMTHENRLRRLVQITGDDTLTGHKDLSAAQAAEVLRILEA